MKLVMRFTAAMLKDVIHFSHYCHRCPKTRKTPATKLKDVIKVVILLSLEKQTCKTFECNWRRLQVRTFLPAKNFWSKFKCLKSFQILCLFAIIVAYTRLVKQYRKYIVRPNCLWVTCFAPTCYGHKCTKQFLFWNIFKNNTENMTIFIV